MKSRPSNPDTPDIKKEKERTVSQAFMAYLSGTGAFADWNIERDDFLKEMVRLEYVLPIY